MDDKYYYRIPVFYRALFHTLWYADTASVIWVPVYIAVVFACGFGGICSGEYSEFMRTELYALCSPPLLLMAL
jgi:hypothetical protein